MYDRFVQLLQEKGVSVYQVSKDTGITQTSLSSWKNGKSTPKLDKLQKIADYFDVTIDYLVGASDNRGYPAKPTAQDFSRWDEQYGDNIKKELSALNAVRLKPIEKQKIPLLGTIAAGQPIFADENFECYVESPVQADYCLRIKGDSMINARIADGDIVFIRQQPDVDDGEIAAVLIDNEATLKRVYRNPYGFTLVSENPKYKPLVFTGDDGKNIKVLGKAVAFQSDIK